MKVVVDDRIPYIKGLIEQVAGSVTYIRGSQISRKDVEDADAMIIRTRTRCDRSLLEGTRVRFIATATIGFDHIDTRYLEEHGIAWTNCPGCNASSVGQYIHSCLIQLRRLKGMDIPSMTLGIVGVGHVGKEVLNAAKSLGMRTLLCDPPRQEAEKDSTFASLEDIQREADIITVHTPLVMDGAHPTYHMIGREFLSGLGKRAVIINSSRGETVDNRALEEALDEGYVREAIIDTWENEPRISPGLLRKAFIATPHIAGYSADGKANSVTMSLNALCRFFHIDRTFLVEPPSLPGNPEIPEDEEERALFLYDPLRDSAWLKSSPERFEELRGSYPLRREKA